MSLTSLGHKTKHSSLKLATVLLNVRRAGGKKQTVTLRKKLDMVAYRLKPKLKVHLEVKNLASPLSHNVT